MKKILPLIIVASMMAAGCGSSKKQMQTGNYQAAIDKAVRELRRNPDNKDEADILQRAYSIANEQDNERIRLLKMENKAASYDEVYLTYKRMHDRQALVRTVTPLNAGGRTIDFPYVDYMADMVTAKQKAADFYYTNGVAIMKNQTKDSYRQAFYQFIRAKEYVGDYPNIDQLIAEAKYLGTSRALVSVENKSIINFPPEFVNDLLALDLPSLNSEWVEYHTQILDPNTTYDYMVYVNVKNVAVSPDQSTQRDTLVKRDVEDGFNYMLDKNGNVMKDSLGNDIKIKNTKLSNAP
jgi:tetratricopeptide (TPR) repeat protein